MAQHRRTYSPEQSRRRSRQVQNSTIGSHIDRGGRPVQRDRTYAEGVARRANARHRALVAFVVVLIVGIAVGAGFLAFRGVVGSSLALKDSDARDALVAPKSGEVRYVLVSAELGAVAQPLDNGGADLFVLIRLDPQARTAALINLPASLQVTFDNQSESLAAVAGSGDAALIQAVSTYAKVDVAHFAKLTEQGFAGMVDALGGVEVDVDQIIDDPRAGTLYLQPGTQVLYGEQALVYLRATNLKRGTDDQFEHQLTFAAALMAKLFSGGGSFAARLDAVGPYLQTDCSLSDFEAAQAWLGSLGPGDYTCVNAPGYLTEVTDVTGTRSGRYVSTSADMATLLEDLSAGRDVKQAGTGDVAAADPASFTVQVHNGTDVTGAAAVVAEQLAAKGFSVSGVGNADQPVYNETLVVYKGDEGPARAKAVIQALDIGRAVEGDVYYRFDSDVLVIIGSDYKPVS